MGKGLAILAGALVLALVAGGLTEATLAIGRQQLSNDVGILHPGAAKASPSVSAKPSPSATVNPTAAPPAASTPAPTPAAATATTNAFVHLRAQASTSSNILANLDGGTTVTLLSYSDPQWQEVQYNGVTGYIFKSYLSY